MAQYALLIYTPTVRETDLNPDELAAHDLHARAITESGAMVAAFALEPADSTATSVRGDAVTDGPFLDAKEVVAGFCIIEAPDLDAALAIARSNPINQQGGGVEVRPVEGGFTADRSATG
jgi:hypothetical protein